MSRTALNPYRSVFSEQQPAQRSGRGPAAACTAASRPTPTSVCASGSECTAGACPQLKWPFCVVPALKACPAERRNPIHI